MRGREHAFLTARQTHQTFGVFRDLVQICCSCSFFFFPQFVTRHETTEILVSRPAFNEQRQPYWPCGKRIRHPRRRPCQVSKTFYGNLGPDMRANPYGLCSHMQSWSTVTPSRSTNAMAGCSNCFARDTRSSG